MSNWAWLAVVLATTTAAYALGVEVGRRYERDRQAERVEIDDVAEQVLEEGFNGG